jgi:transposase
VLIRPWGDEAARQRIEQQYFGLRLLATTHEEWTTSQILEASRGPSRVERAFRDRKDPWVCAFRPQHHGTGQKLVVHAWIAVLNLLLGRLLLRRAQRAGYQGGLRGLVQRLRRIRIATIAEKPAGRGRPQVYQRIEECDPGLRRPSQILSAIGD